MTKPRLRPDRYADKRKNRLLNKAEKRRIMTLFIEDRMTPQEITVLMNSTLHNINNVIFVDVKPFKNFFNRGVCAFGKKTAYWETEQQLLESFEPKYSENDLTGDELIMIRFSKGEIKIKNVMSKFK